MGKKSIYEVNIKNIYLSKVDLTQVRETGADRQTDKQTGRQADRQTDTQTHRHTDIQTDRQTDTKVNTEDTLSGFQEFFLQPIIKDRSNMCKRPTYQRPISNGAMVDGAPYICSNFDRPDSAT